MKKLRISMKNKRRDEALASLQELSARRGKIGAGLLRSALSQLRSGDVESARRSVERFELAAPGLSKSDLGILQGVKDGMGEPSHVRLRSVLRAILCAVLVKGISAAIWHGIKALFQNYFGYGPLSKNVNRRPGGVDRLTSRRFASLGGCCPPPL